MKRLKMESEITLRKSKLEIGKLYHDIKSLRDEGFVINDWTAGYLKGLSKALDILNKNIERYEKCQ